ncbi:MAG: tRNA pseudouridine(38-40) synthase TruA [Myxococcales bacterium]|nr:tRNA pseudouridine(38-40) synthase TruA [Myxococcales bacterium]USN50788.1 MAG: tRNA pseudouridine(38-40) synthase TruA [Myxococcales bacterium]
MDSKKFKERTCFLLSFSYLGEGFLGVQEQPGLRTVLGALRERIEQLAGQKACAMCVAARTDRGVQALDNFVTFYLRNPCDASSTIEGLLRTQEPGLFIKFVKRVSPHVHARANAHGKLYRYTILDNCADTETQNLAWHIAPSIDIDAMKKAVLNLIGEHDFSSFRGRRCGAKNPVKYLKKITIARVSQCFVVIEVEGNGFLRYMIRNIVGTLVEVGTGLRNPVDVKNILDAKDRQAAGIMAPAHGLCLVKVNFKVSDKDIYEV